MKWELNVIKIFLLSTVFHTVIMGMARLLELNLNEFDCDLQYRYIDTLSFECKLTDIQDYRSDPTKPTDQPSRLPFACDVDILQQIFTVNKILLINLAQFKKKIMVNQKCFLRHIFIKTSTTILRNYCTLHHLSSQSRSSEKFVIF